MGIRCSNFKRKKKTLDFIMVDAFVGKFVVESRDNYDGFMKGVGVPDEYIEKGRSVNVVTEISKSGDNIIMARVRAYKTVTNTLTFGKDCELENIKGEKVMVKPELDGGKVVCKGSNYLLQLEMSGGKLHEKITYNGHTMSRVSKPQ